jgi:hypothetical protein
MNRRDFLQSVTLASSVTPLLMKASVLHPFSSPQSDDEDLCKSKFQLAISKEWAKLPINEVIVNVGKTFLGTKYVEHVLEAPGEEHLVVNMKGLDCVTFYENSLVIARCIKKNKMTFDDYRKELQFIRYRGGVINGYASRLHYTSDYLYDNEKKGVWKIVTKELGGVPYTKKLDFMSTHADSYWQIRESDNVKKQIEEMEQDISKRELYSVPKSKVAEISDKILNGDIMGITTNVEGIDTSHTGIAIWENGSLHFMHAPLAGKKVQISEKTLSEYLASNKRQTGIMVARPLEPI